MQPEKPDHQQSCVVHDAAVGLAELVVGLRWDPLRSGAAAPALALDLDVACVLLDGHGSTMGVIHSGNPRHTNDSVIHTGDSQTGAGEWDDERIYVFPAAVPEAVAALTFVVANVSGRCFADVPRGVCHVSDHASEREWIHCELAGLGAATVHAVATLYRSAGAWKICAGLRDASAAEWIGTQLLPLLVGAKRADVKAKRSH